MNGDISNPETLIHFHISGGDTEREADINIFVNMVQEGNEYVELDYICKGEPINYKVKLVSVPSNLGIGKIWYFFCPYVKKRCRVLYSVDQYFSHREAGSVV